MAMDLALLLRAIGEPRTIMLQSERTLNNSDRYLFLNVRFNYMKATTDYHKSAKTSSSGFTSVDKQQLVQFVYLE